MKIKLDSSVAEFVGELAQALELGVAIVGERTSDVVSRLHVSLTCKRHSPNQISINDNVRSGLFRQNREHGGERALQNWIPSEQQTQIVSSEL